MPTLQAPLLPDGAIVDVQVGLSRQDIRQLRQASSPIPQPVNLRGLLDTGADTSCIDPSALQKLTLTMAGAVITNVPAAGGHLAVLQYYAGLRITHSTGDPRQDLVIADLLLAEVQIGVLGYELLLGRDVLQMCRFVYDGLADEFELTWK